MRHSDVRFGRVKVSIGLFRLCDADWSRVGGSDDAPCVFSPFVGFP